MRLHSELTPNLAKRNTLLIHGNLASSQWWQPMLHEWQKQGSLGSGGLISADIRGCGQSADWAIDQIFSLKDLAEDLLQLLDEQKWNDVDLVGHSLGGLIALQMMALQPSRFAHAVLLDSVGSHGVVFDDSMYEAFKQMSLSRDLTGSVILSTVRNSENLTTEFREHIVDDAFKAVKGVGSSVLQILKSVDLESQISQIEVPILILHGQYDQVIPLQDSIQLARHIPHSKLEVLPEAGHCWNIESPVEFTSRVRDWL